MNVWAINMNSLSRKNYSSLHKIVLKKIVQVLIFIGWTGQNTGSQD